MAQSSHDPLTLITQKLTHSHPPRRDSRTLTSALPTLRTPTTKAGMSIINKQTPIGRDPGCAEDSELFIESKDFLEEFQNFDGDDDHQMDCQATNSKGSNVGLSATISFPKSSMRKETTFFNQLCEGNEYRIKRYSQRLIIKLDRVF